MKKILLLIPALNAGGSERVMVTLANEWSKDNDVSILIFHNTDSFYELSDQVKLIKMGLSLPPNGLKRVLSIPSIEVKRYRYIREYVSKGNYDFILSFTNVTNIFSCIMSKKIKGQFFAISERADPRNYSSFMKLLIRKMYKNANLVICQNKVAKEYFENCGFQNDLIVLPNPINFKDIPDEVPKRREQIISTAGRLTNEKNHKLLIDAFNEVHKVHPNYQLRIYGIGPLELELKKQIDSLGLGNSVKLMGAKKKVMYEINQTEIFVLTSNNEGFPNVLIEAMATQMPVISSDFATGVAKDLINDGVNGYLFPVGDKNQLVEVMSRLIERSSDFGEMGSINKKIAMNYKDEIMAKTWLDMICKHNKV